jgi:hypothetical protein
VDEGRLRVFFAVRDEAKRVARFDLHPGEVQAFHAVAKRALFSCNQVDTENDGTTNRVTLGDTRISGNARDIGFNHQYLHST